MNQIDKSGQKNIVIDQVSPLTSDEDPNTNIIHESLLTAFRRRLWIVVLTILVALAAGLAYVKLATPRYESTSRLYVEQNGPRILNDLEEGVMTQSNQYLYTQAELIKSADRRQPFFPTDDNYYYRLQLA